jgi:phenylalanyl-tRNA synthetase beta chain
VLDVKGVLETLMIGIGVEDWSLEGAPSGPFQPGRSAWVLVEGERAGVMGEVHPRVAASLEIQGRVAVAELEVEVLMGARRKGFVVREPPRFPPVRRDLAFVVPEDVPAGVLQATLEEAAGELLSSCLLFDVFRGPSLPEGTKSLAFALDFRAPDRTLTGEETDPVVERIAARIRSDLGGTLRAGSSDGGSHRSDGSR